MNDDTPTYTSITDARDMILQLRGTTIAHMELVSYDAIDLLGESPHKWVYGHVRLAMVNSCEPWAMELQALYGSFSFQHIVENPHKVLPALDQALRMLGESYPEVHIAGSADALQRFSAESIMGFISENFASDEEDEDIPF